MKPTFFIRGLIEGFIKPKPDFHYDIDLLWDTPEFQNLGKLINVNQRECLANSE